MTDSHGITVEKRKAGRPKGSKTKIPPDAKALVTEKGIPGLLQLCAIARGRPVYRRLRGGARECLVPTLDQMISAQKFIAARLVPELKATEISGEIATPDLAATHDPRQLGRAILAALGHGIAHDLAHAHTDTGAKLLELQAE